MRVNFDKMGLITPSNMTVTALYRLEVMNKFQRKSSLKLEIHGVVGKTCQNPSKTHKFQLWGHFGGRRTKLFLSKISE